MSLWSRRSKPGALESLPQLSFGHALPEVARSGGVATPPAELTAQYKLCELLGSGSVAVVRRAVRRSGAGEIAVKHVGGCDLEMLQFTRAEFELGKRLRHVGIVSFGALYEDSSGIWISMELCNQGSVESYVSQHAAFSSESAHALFTQLLLVLYYLHKKRIVHRDIKPDNLLLTDSARTLKITDFNSAKQIGGEAASAMLTDRGTRLYSAPELRFGNLWNERVDIWSCGLCLYYMLRGEVPFNIQKRSTAKVLLTGRLPSIVWNGVLELDCNLIQQCLTVDMRDRPPAMVLLRHRCFADAAGQQNISGISEVETVRPVQAKEEACSFFSLLASCGLISVHPLQQYCPQTGDSNLAGVIGDTSSRGGYPGSPQRSVVNQWRERRDGAYQLERLSESRFERTAFDNVKTRAEEPSCQDQSDESQVYSGQPSLRALGRRQFYTRSSRIDKSDSDDERPHMDPGTAALLRRLKLGAE